MSAPPRPSSETHPLRSLFDQVKQASDAGFYYPGLLSALSIPHICGAMDSAYGRGIGSTYVAWFDKWVGPKYVRDGKVIFTGKDCYELRCSFLHQGRGRTANPDYPRVCFTLDLQVGLMTFRGNTHLGMDSGSYFGFSPKMFCDRMVTGASDWLATSVGTTDFERNYNLFIRFRPAGLPGFDFGAVLY